MQYKTLNVLALKQNISQRVLDDIENERICGASVAVLQRGELVYKDHFGYQTALKEKTIRKDALFRIASMTKPITTVAVLLQAQRGLLHLEDRVSEYLPAYDRLFLHTNGQYCTQPLLIWHLLTHTSGMEATADYRPTMFQMPSELLQTLEGAVSFYALMPLAFEPGTKRCYSGFAAFDVLARIVEVTSGKRFEDFLQEEIFSPCEMIDTTFAPNEEQWKRLVGMHNYVEGHGIEVPIAQGYVIDGVPVTHPLGGGGLISSIDDYIRFGQMLMNQGRTIDGRILNREWTDRMASAQLPMEMMSDTVNQGLGVRVITDEKYMWLPVGSFGWSGAFGTHFWIDPVNQIFAIYMKNSLYDGGAEALTGKHFEEDVFRSLDCTS